ncbi:MAG: hypothetical protein JXX14_16080, partial [Deltaproteobacteria bacterium]|nr:hypothetical protein [Deltaproteobacteria bacterium]
MNRLSKIITAGFKCINSARSDLAAFTVCCAAIIALVLSGCTETSSPSPDTVEESNVPPKNAISDEVVFPPSSYVESDTAAELSEFFGDVTMTPAAGECSGDGDCDDGNLCTIDNCDCSVE